MSVFSSHLGGSHGSGHEDSTWPSHYCSGHGLAAGFNGTNLLGEGINNEQLVPPTPTHPHAPGGALRHARQHTPHGLLLALLACQLGQAHLSMSGGEEARVSQPR